MKKIASLSLLFMYWLATSYAQPAGNLDSSFGTKGIVRTDFGASVNIYGAYGRQLLTRVNGVVYFIFTTNEQTIITRFLANGSIDPSYGSNGYSQVIPGSAVMQADGKIVVAGGNNIGRYSLSGRPDNTFGKHGIVTSGISDINGVAIQNDGKIVVAGFNVLARYNTDGSPDSTLNGNIPTGESPSIAIQSDGKIVVFGTFKPLDQLKNTDGDYRSYAKLTRLNANGSIDSVFGKYGRSDSVGSYSIANSVLVQSDGKIVVVDSNTPAIARYNTDGKFDSSFSGDGIEYIDDLYIEGEVQPLAIQSDGKILVAGVVSSSGDNIGEDFAVVRYNTDGTRDVTFSSDGMQTTDFGVYDFVSAVAVQNDGRIVVAGNTSGINTRPDFALTRYSPNGDPDTTFSNDGKFAQYVHAGYTNYNSAAIEKDGKIVVAGAANTGNGKDFALARYNTDGNLDTTFSGDGKQTTNFKDDDEVHSVIIQSDGKIVAAGISNMTNSFPPGNKFAIARYNTNGSIDTAFSAEGRLPDDFAFGTIGQAVAAESNGKIMVALSGGAYYSPVYILARFNPDGTLDTTFSKDGLRKSNFKTAYQDAQCIAVQSDGKIVVAGSAGSYPDYNFAIARYNADGTNDTTFSKDGKQTTDFGGPHVARARAVAIQDDGKIVVAGSKEGKQGNLFFAIARYNTDGTLDTTFSGDGKQTTAFESTDGASSLVIQKDGKIVAAGNSNGNFAIARYNSNGSLDSSFGTNGKRITEASKGIDGINGIVISGNKLYVAGGGETPGNVGIVARYLLNEIPTVISSPAKPLVSSRPSSADIKTNTNAEVTLQLAPNPSHNMLNIYITGLRQDKPQTISVISPSGIVMKNMLTKNANKVISLDVSSLPAGVYIIKLLSDGKILYKQFVKL